MRKTTKTKRKTVDTYKDKQQCNGGDSKSCISSKRKLGQLPFISYSDRQIKRQTDRVTTESGRYMGIRKVTEWHVQATDAHLSHSGGYAYSVGI